MPLRRFLDNRPDFEAILRRMDAFWNCSVADRAVVQITAPRPDPQRSPPARTWTSLRERWLDTEWQVETYGVQSANTYYAGEAVPVWWPNLGPEVMAAAYGAELEFSETTSWSKPLLTDWDQISDLRLDLNNEYVLWIANATRMALEMAQGRFLVGITDLHPGGDLAAALRNPQQLCEDMLDEPERVAELMHRLRPAFYEFYELQYKLLAAAGQAITTTWTPLFADGRFYVPSNDFSCMVSPAMMRAFFLEEIHDECRWLDRSIYHLDGPDALRHLDLILEIPELHAVQWVFGAGNGPASKWLDVYARIQQAGKALQVVECEPWELDAFFERLDPEGVAFSMSAGSLEEADYVVGRVGRWIGRGRC